MNWLGIQSIAHVAVERVLNSLPEGLLVALFTWVLLRLIGRRNSGTRFAVWFTALIAVIGLSFAGGFQLNEAHTLLPTRQLTTQIVVVLYCWKSAQSMPPLWASSLSRR